ncbi:MAG: hypothetical protein QOH56_4297 [Pseudonocardiales bacterium]|nr:hypothetical protein [Pseudonocardiales bacterium]
MRRWHLSDALRDQLLKDVAPITTHSPEHPLYDGAESAFVRPADRLEFRRRWLHDSALFPGPCIVGG